MKSVNWYNLPAVKPNHNSLNSLKVNLLFQLLLHRLKIEEAENQQRRQVRAHNLIHQKSKSAPKFIMCSFRTNPLHLIVWKKWRIRWCYNQMCLDILGLIHPNLILLQLITLTMLLLCILTCQNLITWDAMLSNLFRQRLMEKWMWQRLVKCLKSMEMSM